MTIFPGSADRDAFDRLLGPQLPRLYRLAYRLTGTVADAEDLLQDVLIKLYGRRQELTSIEDLSPWLSRVLYNQFVDDRRRFARRRLAVVNDSSPEGAAQLDALPAGNLDPADEAALAFDITQLHVALQQLSDEHREVVLLHDAEGYTLEEVHRITGVAVGTLKSRLHRARARLRELIEVEPFEQKLRVSY